MYVQKSNKTYVQNLASRAQKCSKMLKVFESSSMGLFILVFFYASTWKRPI